LRSCRYCASGRPYLCQTALDVRFAGTLANGERRLADGDGPVNHFYAQSSFATATVVTEESVIPVDESVGPETAAALGCGATTGIGAVLNTAAVEAGARVAVFGCGGTGMSAVMAADAAGATEVVAVDVEDWKLETARDHGATVTVVGDGKTVVGNVAGSARPLVDVPRFAATAAAGKLDLASVTDASYAWTTPSARSPT
jgi:Zn-dependent alcohol dehydrogenase